jgi:DNA-binding helix-hairpin-helix protein with protein kinase domain
MEAELHHLLSQWQAITQAERRAIDAESWAELNRQQILKEELMPKLTATLNRWRANFDSPEKAREAQRARFQPAIDRLILQEKQNQAVLKTRSSNLKAELDTMDQSVSRLRNVQKAYGAPATSMWRSYS